MGFSLPPGVPAATRAQQSIAFPRIGILFANKSGLAHALLASLAERGYVDGKRLTFLHAMRKATWNSFQS